jgi:hypothetical protein
MSTSTGRSVAALLAAVTALSLGLGTVVASTTLRGLAAAPSVRRIDLNGSHVRYSSVALGDLNGDGVDDIVVGGSDGKVHAYRGTGAKLWDYDTGNASIESKAAIGDINGDGWNEVVVGVGSTFTGGAPGGVWALDHNGGKLWSYASGDFNGDGTADGVYSSPALADVDGNDGGKLEIIYGSWDAHIRVLNHNGTLLWEKFVRDTIWSSPAIGDIDRDGKLEIAIGADSNSGGGSGWQDGGRLWVLNGENGSDVPGFPKQIDEVIWSSPALGDITGDGRLDVVVGTGNCWSVPACAPPPGGTHPVTKALYGWDHNGNPLPGWPIMLSDYAFASPSLADLDGDDALEVMINTNDGYVRAYNLDKSYVSGWPKYATPAANASPVVADLNGDGNLEVVLPCNWALNVWERTGTFLWGLGTNYTVNGTPAVGDVDGDDKMELVVGGAANISGSPGSIYIWDLNDAPSTSPAPWPAFRRDSLNHARYPLGQLSVHPSWMLVLHQDGSGSSETAYLWVSNNGDGTIDWQVDSKPSAATLTPDSGTVGWSPESIEVDISVGGYGPGLYDLGDIVISAIGEGEAVVGSPATIPVTLYVGDVHGAFLPLALRQY